jgi:hypothetical protein
MTNAAEINSDKSLCHDPKGWGGNQSKVGEGGKRFPNVIWYFSFAIVGPKQVAVTAKPIRLRLPVVNSMTNEKCQNDKWKIWK